MYFTPYSQNTTDELFRTFINLIESKNISVIIEEVSLPALSWDSEFRDCDHATIREDFLRHCIEILYLHRTHKGICRSLHVLIPRRLTLHESTHHPARLDTIVGDRNMRIKLKRPAKDRAIKTDRRFRICHLDFKVGRGVHNYWVKGIRISVMNLSKPVPAKSDFSIPLNIFQFKLFHHFWSGFRAVRLSYFPNAV